MGLGDAVSSVTEAASKGIVKATGKINEQVRKGITMLDPQPLNVFSMFLYPASTKANISAGNKLSSIASSLGSAALDTSLTKLHVQSIDVPFASFEHEKLDLFQYTKDYNQPDQVTFTLIENDLAFVRMWYKKWLDEIIVKAKIGSSLNSANQDSYVFKDDQEAAMKNAVIFLQTGTGIPSPGWVKLHGLLPKSLNNLTLDHGEGQPYKMQLTCKVNEVLLETPAQVIKSLF